MSLSASSRAIRIASPATYKPMRFDELPGWPASSNAALSTHQGRSSSPASTWERALQKSEGQWRRHASVGICSLPSPSQDCTFGFKGRWRLPQGSEANASTSCVALCRGCTRCMFISLNLRTMDCAWFHFCDVTRLTQGWAAGYLSAAVARPKPRPEELVEGASGYCAATSFAGRGGDCLHGTSGWWPLSGVHTIGGWLTTARACQMLCEKCESCRYFATSLHGLECQWFAACDLDALEGPSSGYRTFSRHATLKLEDSNVYFPQQAEEDRVAVNHEWVDRCASSLKLHACRWGNCPGQEWSIDVLPLAGRLLAALLRRPKALVIVGDSVTRDLFILMSCVLLPHLRTYPDLMRNKHAGRKGFLTLATYARDEPLLYFSWMHSEWAENTLEIIRRASLVILAGGSHFQEGAAQTAYLEGWLATMLPGYAAGAGEITPGPALLQELDDA